MVTFWPADVEIVKPEADTLPTVPDAPPAAGPDRALDPAAGPAPLATLLPLLALVPEFELTIPYVPPAIAIATALATMELVTLRENIAAAPSRGCFTSHDGRGPANYSPNRPQAGRKTGRRRLRFGWG